MKTYCCEVRLPVYITRAEGKGKPTKQEMLSRLSENLDKSLPGARVGECQEAKEKRKRFLVNLNPQENPKVGYPNMGLLFNPFPRSAAGYGGSGSFGWDREMVIKRHLRDGVALEHAQWLLRELLTEEARDAVLDGMKPGDRREVIVIGRGEKGEIRRRDITKEQMDKLRGKGYRQEKIAEAARD